MENNNYVFPDFDAEIPDEEPKTDVNSTNPLLPDQFQEFMGVIKFDVGALRQYMQTHKPPKSEAEHVEFLKAILTSPTGQAFDDLLIAIRSGNVPGVGNNISGFVDKIIMDAQNAMTHGVLNQIMNNIPALIASIGSDDPEEIKKALDSSDLTEDMKNLILETVGSENSENDEEPERNPMSRNVMDLGHIPFQLGRAVIGAKISDNIVDRFASQYASFYDSRDEFYRAGMFTNKDIPNFDNYLDDATIDISKCKLSYVEVYNNKFIVMRAHPKLKEYESFFVCLFLDENEQFKIFVPLLTNALVDNTEDCMDVLFDFSNVEVPKSKVERYGLISRKKFPEFFNDDGALHYQIDIDGIIHDAYIHIVCNDAGYPVTMPLGNFPLLRLLDQFEPDNSAHPGPPITKDSHYFYIGTATLTESPEIKQFCKDYGIFDMVDIDLYVDSFLHRHNVNGITDMHYRSICKYLSMVAKYNHNVFSKIDVKTVRSGGKNILVIKL